MTDIAKRLEQICKKEKAGISDEARFAVARFARGSMRDSLSVLDQLISFADGKIEMDQVKASLGMAGDDEMAEILAGIAKADAATVLRAANRLMEAGMEAESLLRQLGEYLRDVMIARYCPDNPELLNRPPDMAEPLRKQAEDFSTDSLLYMVELTSSARRRARGDLEGRIAMEMTLVKLASVGKLRSIEELIQRLEALEGGRPAPPVRPALAAAESASSKEKVSERQATYSADSGQRSLWQQVQENVRSENSWAHLHLMQGRLSDLNDEEVVIEYEPEMRHHIQHIEEPDIKKLVEKGFQQALGRPVRLITRVSSGAEADAGKEAATPAAKSFSRDDPVVKKIIDMFDAKVLGTEG